MSKRTAAALYVDPRGVYADLPGVELWPEGRDARQYPGPHPIVAHPPCARWGRYATVGGRQRGDDGGCAAAAVAALAQWGGVLEHPANSGVWSAHGFHPPSRHGGWQNASILLYDSGWWTCHVEQGWYGHMAPKPTWLLVRTDAPEALPTLRWGASPPSGRRAGYTGNVRGVVELLSCRQREATPPEFRDLLLAIARSVGVVR